jgi:anti-sigma B factor antagonist
MDELRDVGDAGAVDAGDGEQTGDVAPFAVEVTRNDGDDEAIVAFRGELDLSVADRARDAVQQVVATAPARLVYDLTDLTFIDSSGLTVLLESAEQVAVEVRRASPIAARLIETTGIGGVLHFDGKPS